MQLFIPDFSQKVEKGLEAIFCNRLYSLPLRQFEHVKQPAEGEWLPPEDTSSPLNQWMWSYLEKGSLQWN